MSERPRRILFVGMQASPHVTRWIETIVDQGWELHMFPISGEKPLPELRGVTIHWPVLPDLTAYNTTAPVDPHRPSPIERVRRFLSLFRDNPGEAWKVARRKLHAMKPAMKQVGSPPEEVHCANVENRTIEPTVEELGGLEAISSGRVRLGESDADAPTLHGPRVLAKLIQQLQPDLIHSMEFQHCGYLTLAAKDVMGEAFPPWLATNWGSDIFYFQRFDDHLAQIKRVLASADFYSCECQRDVRLAREHGFEGVAMPVLPNSGGLDMRMVERSRSSTPPSERKAIILKCYDHFAGRGMMVLDVVDRFRDRLKDYEIILYSLSAGPRSRAMKMKREGALNIRIIEYVPHEEMLAHFGRSRLYMAISISDGVSTSSLEAMAMGAFPIQTMTACCDEWFDDGVGGFHTDPDDFEMICERFGRALQDDALVDAAAVVNSETVESRLDTRVVAPKVKAYYDQAFASMPVVKPKRWGRFNPRQSM
ncbi:MAG: glycosyltransferase [Pseudomonadota bacterium]